MRVLLAFALLFIFAVASGCRGQEAPSDLDGSTDLPAEGTPTGDVNMPEGVTN